MILTLLCAGIGGFLGSALRVGIGMMIAKLGLQTLFPLSTFLVNASGSFIIGLLLSSPQLIANAAVKTLLTSGFLGGLTTFSTFSYESIELLTQRQFHLALINLLSNIGVSLLLCFIGAHISSRLFN